MQKANSSVHCGTSTTLLGTLFSHEFPCRKASFVATRAVQRRFIPRGRYRRKEDREGIQDRRTTTSASHTRRKTAKTSRPEGRPRGYFIQAVDRDVISDKKKTARSFHPEQDREGVPDRRTSGRARQTKLRPEGMPDRNNTARAFQTNERTRGHPRHKEDHKGVPDKGEDCEGASYSTKTARVCQSYVIPVKWMRYSGQWLFLCAESNALSWS